jgi:RNA polymerase sigma-70 factor (ECF subfamily)
VAETVLEKVATGELGAVEECLARYGGLVWTLAQRFSPNLADAEDAVQEVFTDLWRYAKRFDPRVSPEATFVAMIARRRLIDRRRRLTRRVPTTDLDQALAVAAAPAPQALELRDEVRRVRDLFGHLREEERQVLELAICHGLSQTQISARTGLPLGTVKTHARQGLIRLRKLVADPQIIEVGGEQ